MIGALSPDFTKIDLVFPDELVSYLLDIPSRGRRSTFSVERSS